MRRIIMMTVAAMLLTIGVSRADSQVAVPSCTFTAYRGEGANYVSSDEFYRGESLLFTNCVLGLGSDSTAGWQGLTNVTVVISVGTTSTNNDYTATVVTGIATNTWFYKFTAFPTNWEAPNIQIKITDSGTNSYIYPWKLIHTKQSM